MRNSPRQRTLWDMTGGTIGSALDPRRNALNALRLVLALLVIVSHAWPLGGFAHPPMPAGQSLGIWAVYGFFAISGYLIVGARTTTTGGRYLWHRCLRIFPALWVCLALTVFTAWLVTGQVGWSYLWNNAVLRTTYDIAGGPQGVPHPGAWNGALWTLQDEFLCYLAVAVAASIPLLRRQEALVGSVVALVVLDVLLPGYYLVTLLATFAVGGLLFALRSRVPDSPWLFAVALLSLPLAAVAPALAAPGLAYAMLWLGIHLPVTQITERRDISYGVYIYAFPVAQLLAMTGVQRFGVGTFALLCVAGTVPLAVVSRVWVETPARRLKRWSPSLGHALEREPLQHRVVVARRGVLAGDHDAEQVVA